MRRLRISRSRRKALLLGVLLAGAALAQARGLVAWSHGDPAQGGGPWRRVLRVVDGDTVVLDGRERVRLIGVDTPELNDRRAEQRYLAKRAAVFLEDLVAGREVRLEHDRERQDRYGRTLAYVYLRDGTFTNAEVVRRGWSPAFTRYPFRHASRFRELEGEARAARRGIWAAQDAR